MRGSMLVRLMVAVLEIVVVDVERVAEPTVLVEGVTLMVRTARTTTMMVERLSGRVVPMKESWHSRAARVGSEEESQQGLARVETRTRMCHCATARSERAIEP